MLKNFDLISDIHLDSYIVPGITDESSRLSEFVLGILPRNIAEVIVVAGDISHYNSQSVAFLQELNRYYSQVVFTPGNHDLYVVDKSFVDSIERINDLKNRVSGLPNIHCLDGDTVDIFGTNFGGAPGWYDYSYGYKIGYTKAELTDIWNKRMMDSFYVSPLPDWREEKQKLRDIVSESDVIITHVPPDDSRMLDKYKNDPVSAFFYFDGSEFFDKLGGKVWCFGHSHHRLIYSRNGCIFAINALGHKGELQPAKIINIPLRPDAIG